MFEAGSLKRVILEEPKIRLIYNVNIFTLFFALALVSGWKGAAGLKFRCSFCSGAAGPPVDGLQQIALCSICCTPRSVNGLGDHPALPLWGSTVLWPLGFFPLCRVCEVMFSRPSVWSCVFLGGWGGVLCFAADCINRTVELWKYGCIQLHVLNHLANIGGEKLCDAATQVG